MSDYYTVGEYAELVGKDPGNIRRMLINGTIKGEKFGKQWMISKDTKYPEDRRLKSGDYKNWRKRMVINHNNPGLLKALTEMSRRIGGIYGDSLDRVILYGSYVRGEQTEESDIDIAILVKESSTKEMHDEMLDLVVDYELDLAVTVSVVSIEYENYLEWNKVLPYYKNIDREGIVLWKAA